MLKFLLTSQKHCSTLCNDRPCSTASLNGLYARVTDIQAKTKAPGTVHILAAICAHAEEGAYSRACAFKKLLIEHLLRYCLCVKSIIYTTSHFSWAEFNPPHKLQT